MRNLLLLLLTVTLGSLAAPAHAALVFELRSGDNATKIQSLAVDSNKCGSEGPRAAYVGGILTNTGARVDNITMSIGGLNANAFLAGGQASLQDIGSLDAGQSVPVFWFVGYSCSIGAVVNPSIAIGSSAGTQTVGLTLQLRSAISANAGGNVMGATLGPGAVVGQTIFFDADYEFGGTDVGDEYFLQPVGGQAFDAACFRLAGSVVTASNIAGIPVGTANKLYFLQPTKQSGNGYLASVRYYFQYQCAGAATSARPYAVQTSGSSNIKYTGNFDGAGSIAIGFPGATNPFVITKSVSSDLAFVGTPGTLTYTVTITNPSIHASELSEIVDTLPTGMTFAGFTSSSSVQQANSSSVPALGAAGTLRFRGMLGQSYILVAGGSVTLEYEATRPTTAGTFVNSAQGRFGTASTSLASTTYSQVDVQPLEVTKISAVEADPVNGGSSPFAIPGAVVRYTIAVANPNPLPVDSDSVVVIDATPPAMRLCLLPAGSPVAGPLEFSEGSSPSGLTYTYGSPADTSDSVEFSADGGVSWDYVPLPGSGGCDEQITHFRVKPAGAFADDGEFLLTARYALD